MEIGGKTDAHTFVAVALGVLVVHCLVVHGCGVFDVTTADKVVSKKEN
jgi:hypothetical protein